MKLITIVVAILAIGTILLITWIKGGSLKDAYPVPNLKKTPTYHTYKSIDNKSTLQLLHFISEESEINVSSTLIMGKKEAMVVTAQATKSSATRLAEEIKKTGLALTYVFLDHAHLDHSQGAVVLKEYFPEAKFIAAPKVAALQQVRMKADDEMAIKRYGDNAAVPSIPFQAYNENTIMLEGNEIQLWNDQYGDVGIGHTDEPHTVIYIPSLKALLPNDICYFGGHINMGGSTKESREKWKAQIRSYMEMDLDIVIPGHVPRVYSSQMTADSVLSFSLQYIEDFEKAQAKAETADELIETMLHKYPNLKHTSALYMGAYINFNQTHRLLFNPRLEKVFSLLPSSFVNWFNQTIMEMKIEEANNIPHNH